MVPAFIAGLLTFLAPCTLPLVPGYLGFISGVSVEQLVSVRRAGAVQRKVFLNGFLYVLGFSVIFVLLGSVIGWLGSTLPVGYQLWITRIGGVFVILFGVFMIQSALLFYEDRHPVLRKMRLPGATWMTREHRLPVAAYVKPGNPFSSIIFGAAFAVGWTPCVGPVLGTILTLAATEAGAAQGAFLLGVFSLGLAVPFLVLAAGIGYFLPRMRKVEAVLPLISIVGGTFILFLGLLVITNMLGVWIRFFFDILSFLRYEETLLEYL